MLCYIFTYHYKKNDATSFIKLDNTNNTTSSNYIESNERESIGKVTTIILIITVKEFT